MKFSLTRHRGMLCLLIVSALLNACGGQQEKTTLLQNSTIQFGAAPTQNSTAQFSGPRNSYTITKLSQTYLVTEIGGKHESVEVADATALRFADLTVNLQVAKNAANVTPENLNRLIELYIAFFNRVPDADGLNYWIGRVGAGMGLDQIAESFYQAALSYPNETGYSATMSNADFVKIIYKNVLGRTGASAPPEQDVAYWVGQLSSGTSSKGMLVATMLNAAHTFAGDPTWGWVPQLLDNKVSVGHFFSVQQGLSYNTPQQSITQGMKIAALITPNDTNAAKNAIAVPDSHLYPFNLVQAQNPQRVVGISGGRTFSLFLRENGDLVGVGTNFFGSKSMLNQVTTPEVVASNVKKISAFENATFILKTDGSLWVTGYNSWGDHGTGAGTDNQWHTTYTNVMNEVKDVSSGALHTLVLKNDGSVWATGNNSQGQYGRGDLISGKEFVKVATGAKAIVAGVSTSFLIKNDDTLWGAGENSSGELGLGMQVQTQSNFIQVLDQIKSVSSGFQFSIALKKDGSLWVSGDNRYGQLGLGDNQTRYAFTQAASDVAKISGKGITSAIIKNDRSLWMTGANTQGQFGNNSLQNQNSFIRIMGNVDQVEARIDHTLVIKEDGTVLGAGSNQVAELVQPLSSSLYQLVGSDAQQLMAGGESSAYIKNDGTLLTSGFANNYLFAAATTAMQSEFKVASENVAAAGIDYFGSMLLQKNGNLLANGQYLGNLGMGQPLNLSKFTLIKENVTQMAFGFSSAFYIDQAGVLYAAGNNSAGQLGFADSIYDPNSFQHNSFSAVQTNVSRIFAGEKNSFLIKTDGSLWATGLNSSGELGFGDETFRFQFQMLDVSGVASVAIGTAHTLILKNDGSVWGSGKNKLGQLATLGNGRVFDDSNKVNRFALLMNDAKAIAAGGNFSLILKKDGTLWATGENALAQLGTGDRINRDHFVQVRSGVKAIAAGLYHHLVLTNQGEVYAVGASINGQLGNKEFSGQLQNFVQIKL